MVAGQFRPVLAGALGLAHRCLTVNHSPNDGCEDERRLRVRRRVAHRALTRPRPPWRFFQEFPAERAGRQALLWHPAGRQTGPSGRQSPELGRLSRLSRIVAFVASHFFTTWCSYSGLALSFRPTQSASLIRSSYHSPEGRKRQSLNPSTKHDSGELCSTAPAGARARHP